MTSVAETLRLGEIYDLPEEVMDLILREIYRWGPPRVDNQGYLVGRVKNVRVCSIDLVLDDVRGRGRWQHIARVPALYPYERRVCIWEPEYYDIKGGIHGIEDWVKYPARTMSLPGAYDIAIPLRVIDRRSEEWIGFKSWIHTHPTFMAAMCRSPMLQRYGSVRSPTLLSKHWFKYELVLAYPSLYGKNGWAKKL